MIVYGGSTGAQQADNPRSLWQFVLEKDCIAKSDNSSCGVCVLAGCGWCGDVTGSTATFKCVAGNSYGPYVNGTCIQNFTAMPTQCQVTVPVPSWFIPVIVVVLILIFALVVATCFVDWRQGSTRTRGYDVVG